MVDEFQDTNDAQMQILYALMQDRDPQNILAVGDDDQGIYRFQGAEISNILNFQDQFPQTSIITLKHNYRSHQTILEGAREVIIQGDERLETHIEGRDKNLIPSGGISHGSLELHIGTNTEQEYAWVAQRVKELIDAGHDPNEIAILAKKHSILQDCIPYLLAQDIPLEYEKSQNILAETHIQQLITMARYIDSLREDVETRDDLLTEILSYPFWGLDRLEIWKFFEKGRGDSSWLTWMQHSQQPILQAIAETFINLSIYALSEPVETILYSLIGETSGAIENISTPYKSYYLNSARLHTHTLECLTRLHTLQQLFSTIQAYQSYDILKLGDALGVIHLYEIAGGIQKEQSFRTGTEAVHCMTAHKSKGLEFQTVIMLHVTQNGWAGKERPQTTVFPANLAIQPEKSSLDDHLRLFFVGLTRAKQQAILVGHSLNPKGKTQEPLVFTQFLTPQLIESPTIPETIQNSWEIATGRHFTDTEHRFLESTLINYRMSPSHVNTFLDVEYGGPMTVFERTILRLPQRNSPAASYGNAFHKVIQIISQEVQSGNDIPPLEALLEQGFARLRKDRLPRNDYQRMQEKLKDNLPVFLEQKKEEFFLPHYAEYSFGKHNLSIEQIPVNGTIDRIEYDDIHKRITIVDFKTSKPVTSWKNSQKQATLDTYQRQLVMYSLFVDYAGLFPGYQVQGKIQFLEPLEGELIDLVFDIDHDTKQDCLRLMEIVYHHILNLDFPDIHQYQQDQRLGDQRFLKDLLSENV
jgi:DNA helicase-2/ATP-dependent DNA helicase PcrA